MQRIEDNLSIKEIIKKWEILRIPFNLILMLIVVVGTFPIWHKIPDQQIYLIENIVSFVCANIFYLIGPFVEIVFGFFKSNLSRHRKYIWIFGTSLSILVALYSISIVYNRYN